LLNRRMIATIIRGASWELYTKCCFRWFYKNCEPKMFGIKTQTTPIFSRSIKMNRPKIIISH